MAVEIIAEVASSHGGDRGLMEAFIAQCAEAGANFVKFQSYQVKTLRTGDPQRDWLAKAELSDEDHHFLIETCAKYHVKFLTTVFHASRVPFLATLGLEAIKIGSGEAMNAQLVRGVLRLFSRTIVSVGLGGGPEVGRWHDDAGRPPLTVLHAVSLYPTLFADAGMRRLRRWLMTDTTPWNFTSGYSDHTVGVEVPKAAIAMGAQTVEVHVTLPQDTRQQPWAKTMGELRELRQYATFIDTITTHEPNADALAQATQKFEGRWQSPQLTA